MVQAYEKTAILMNKVQGLEDTRKEFQPIEDKMIPHLKALNSVTVSVLIQRGVIDVGSAYDFGHWYLSLAIKMSTFEHAQAYCLNIEGSFLKIHSKVLVTIRELLDLDIEASSELDLEKFK